MLNFRLCNILKFTQNSLVLIPYLLNYSQQFFVTAVSWEDHRWKFKTVELLKTAIITKWQKVSQRFIDSSFYQWCRGLACVVKNDWYRLCDVSVTGAWGRIDDSVTAGGLDRGARGMQPSITAEWEYKTTYNSEIYSSSIRQTRQQKMQKCSEWAEIP